MKQVLILSFLFFATVAFSQEQASEKKKELPLEPVRTFSIETDEISWMSVDVSPDGLTIAFDLLGDIYTMPLIGGEAKKITSGMPFDSQPRFSPDGKKMLYTSDKSGGEGVWEMNLETMEDRQITSGNFDRFQSPEYSPDGKYIIVSKAGLRSGTLKLHMYHVDGGTGAELMDKPENLKMTGAAFGNSDQFIWYAQRTGDWQYNAILPQYQLGRYDRETGKSEAMTFRYGSAFRPTLSPDGKWLVYGTRHEAETGLVLRDLKTGNEKWLAYPVQHDDQESRGTRDALPGMSFTPDSKNLVASYGGKLWKIAIDGSGAVQIPFKIKAEIELGPQLDFEYPIEDSNDFVVKQIRDAVPSPDGKLLAFTALDRLYVMDLEKKTYRRLTKFDFTEAQPTWSPDNEWIAFVTWNQKEGAIYKVKVSGKKSDSPIKLTSESAIYETPVWSPDGKKIVALKGDAEFFTSALNQNAPGAGRELVWISASGGVSTFISYSYGRYKPHFSSNNERIFLNDRKEGLVSIRWDGTDEKKIVKVSGPTPPGFKVSLDASEIMISKDEETAIALVYKDIYLVTIPKISAEAENINVSKGEKASFPVKQLSDIGGEFMFYNSEQKKAYWSIGNAFVTYDFEEGKKVEDQRKKYVKSLEGTDEKPKKDTLSYDPEEYRMEIKANRDIPTGDLVLKGARIITMKGDEIIENGVIVIKNNRIAYVGRGSGAEIPKGAKELDLGGKTIIPGFVDTHAHVRPSWDIHKQEAWQFHANLAFGVTTVRDPQTSSTDILTYEDRVKAGDMIGPRIYSTGPGMFWQEQVKDLDHARKLVSRYSKYYDTKTIKMYVAGNRQQRQWILMACKEQEIMPTTEGSLNFKQNLTQIIDGYPGHEHSFPVFPLYKDATELVAFSKTAYTPTLLVAYGGPWAENYYYSTENPHGNMKLRNFTPHKEIDSKTRRRGLGTGPGPGGWFMDEEHVFKRQAFEVAKIVEAGGIAGVGSHGQLQGLGYHWELWSIQSGGMSNHDALKVATIHGANAIGLEKDLGSVESGKLADLVIFNSNPLENIRNTADIEYVIINGRVYEAATLNQILPEVIKLKEQVYQETEPKGVPGIK
ncbi:MAG: amidohydrolase family protein [Cyclobacteriaceae bacterium]|nr:amidohydrolase family protein [Cyclobacteriaceae bacterium]